MDQLTPEKRRELERNFVKSTYDSIAEDFSLTRYKKWPKVDAFLKSQSGLLLDIGCGNGKYLENPSTFNIGCDLSLKLLSICKARGFEVILCDMMRLPFREDIFDTTICVAALHHIITEKRRLECLEGIFKVLRPIGGKSLIQVWSYEQELEKGNPYLKGNKPKQSEKDIPVREVVIEDGVKIPVHKNRTPFANQDLLVPFHTKRSSNHPTTSSVNQVDNSSPHLRYYHVFKKDELDSMLKMIPKLTIVESYYDRGNWCSVIQK